jgi:hypothetical protein
MHAARPHDTGPVGCRPAACVWTWVFNHAHHHSWLPTCGRGPAAANPDSQGLLHEPAVEPTGTSSIITVNSTTTDAKSDVLYEEGDPAEAALAEKRDGIMMRAKAGTASMIDNMVETITVLSAQHLTCCPRRTPRSTRPSRRSWRVSLKPCSGTPTG